ncbi:MAG: hypothetical protein IKR76_04260 [Ruminococcus sp.]|nr:hypothetical protein [Ruminococcus sp.]
MTDEYFNGEYMEYEGCYGAEPSADTRRRLKKALCLILAGIIMTALSLIYIVPQIQHSIDYPASVGGKLYAAMDKTGKKEEVKREDIKDGIVRIYIAVERDEKFRKVFVYTDDPEIAESYYNADQDVKVLYDPDDPDDYIVVAEKGYKKAGSYILLGAGLICFAAGLISLVVFRKRQPVDELDALNKAYDKEYDNEYL